MDRWVIQAFNTIPLLVAIQPESLATQPPNRFDAGLINATLNMDGNSAEFRQSTSVGPEQADFALRALDRTLTRI